MASLSDIYAPTGNAPLAIANNDLEAGQASEDAGIGQQRLLRNFSERQLPSLVNANAARGTFYGGQIGVQTDQLKQDVGDQYGDIQRRLNATLANLRRNSVLASMGIAL